MGFGDFPCHLIFGCKERPEFLHLYENRSPAPALQGFVWGINSFDQWGVELGKVLASQVRRVVASVRTSEAKSGSDGAAAAAPTKAALKAFCPSTQKLMARFLAGKTHAAYPDARSAFPGNVLALDGAGWVE